VTARAQWEHPGSPSSATDDSGQGRQIHVLGQAIPLIYFDGTAEGHTGPVEFRVEVPDSRLRVNIALIGQPGPGVDPNFIGGKGLTLWLRAVEDAVRGGAEVPITNLWGTSAVPGPIPGYIPPSTGLETRDTDLGGFGKEFVTSGNAIVGTVIVPPEMGTAGNGSLILQVRWTPEAIRFPRDEWYEIRGQCDACIKGNPITGAH
jgi:hypothetical protein